MMEVRSEGVDREEEEWEEEEEAPPAVAPEDVV